MPKLDEMYLANLSFLLNYDTGETNDEIESEIFKVALQQKGAVHYDRGVGGGFQDIEQEPQGYGTFFKFASNLISSVYYVNEEKGFNPYIVVGFSDISESTEGEAYVISVQYRLLRDINVTGTVVLNG